MENELEKFVQVGSLFTAIADPEKLKKLQELIQDAKNVVDQFRYERELVRNIYEVDEYRDQVMKSLSEKEKQLEEREKELEDRAKQVADARNSYEKWLVEKQVEIREKLMELDEREKLVQNLEEQAKALEARSKELTDMKVQIERTKEKLEQKVADIIRIAKEDW